jgi:predicted adenine nucleotide alpha hydrolase (AANH) superfamily ATPase
MKPTLLLHACCAPCSSSVLERLEDDFEITLFFYNPNIHPLSEHERRLTELRGFLAARTAPGGRALPLVETAYEPEDFYRATNARNEPALQAEGERGERCRRCYWFRMKAAFEYARKGGFAYMTTTLSLSPHKDAVAINRIGKSLEEESSGEGGTRFFCADFKKQDGFKRSLELSKKFNLYRQSYCGCEYSLYNRRDGALQR